MSVRRLLQYILSSSHTYYIHDSQKHTHAHTSFLKALLTITFAAAALTNGSYRAKAATLEAYLQPYDDKKLQADNGSQILVDNGHKNFTQDRGVVGVKTHHIHVCIGQPSSAERAHDQQVQKSLKSQSCFPYLFIRNLYNDQLPYADERRGK